MFGFFISVQRLRLWLADGPRDARKGSEQNRKADGFVKAKHERSAGHGLRIRAVGLNGVGQIVAVDTKRDHQKDAKGNGPVKEFGDGAVVVGGVGQHGTFLGHNKLRVRVQGSAGWATLHR